MIFTTTRRPFFFGTSGSFPVGEHFCAHTVCHDRGNRLLRPELVKRFDVPLASDAFSPFIARRDRSQHDDDVQKATDLLVCYWLC